MRRLIPLFGLLSLLAGDLAAAPAEPGEWLFINGGVYTVDRDRPWAEAVVVRDGRIVFVGDNAEASARAGADTRVVDLAGRLLLPGFHDSHVHPMGAGTRFLRCQLAGLEWPDAVLRKVADCAADLDDGDWLRAEGLPDAALQDPRATSALLDRYTGEHPAVLRTHLNHSVLVNSTALRAAKIGAATPDPKRGAIERNPDTGEPTGILHGEAWGVIWRLSSIYRQHELRLALQKASAIANAFGVTTANEASASPEHWAAYRQAEAAGEMTLRVHASLRWDPDTGPGQLTALRPMLEAPPGPRFRAGSVKLFLDAGGYDGASVLRPYAGTSQDYGDSRYGDRLPELVTRLDRAGVDAHFHAYGDRAVRDALDAVERARRDNPPRDRRHHVAHLALVDAADLPRFAELDVTADVQPLWAHWTGQRAGEAERFGPERAARLIPIRSLFEAGARVAAGSDWYSESMNPLVAIQYAVTRRPLDGSGSAWIPEERATLAQMIEAYTVNGAWLARQEHETGTIEVGKAADLVVLDRNLFAIDPMKLHETRVLLTLLEGQAVYSDSTSLASARISAGISFTRATRASQRGSSRSFSK
jgi:predicted amidohydrolase YtcJ